MNLDREHLELRDPDTDSEPWPAYSPDGVPGPAIVLVLVVTLAVVAVGVWWLGVR